MTTKEQILKFVNEYIAENGYSPSLREIGEATGLSASNVAYHLRKMQKTGQVSYQDRIARSIRITSPN